MTAEKSGSFLFYAHMNPLINPDRSSVWSQKCLVVWDLLHISLIDKQAAEDKQSKTHVKIFLYLSIDLFLRFS